MPRHVHLCRPSEIPEATGRGFSLSHPTPDGPRELLVVRRGDQCFAYHNRCPHRGLTLDWSPGHFLDAAARYIQCANHDALFRIEDGVCVAGPCVGARLQAIPTSIDNDCLIVALAD